MIPDLRQRGAICYRLFRSFPLLYSDDSFGGIPGLNASTNFCHFKYLGKVPAVKYSSFLVVMGVDTIPKELNSYDRRICLFISL